MTQNPNLPRVLKRQSERLAQRIRHLKRRSDQLSNVRLLFAVIAIPAISVLYFLPDLRLLFVLALALSIGVFTALVVMHRRVQAQMQTYETWQAIKQEHLARIRLDFDGIPRPRWRNTSPHPLEVDLDLGQLHHLLDTATSVQGSQRLRDWLLPLQPDAELVQRRQAQVKELVGARLFRDKLILRARVAAEDMRSSAEGQSLVEWLADDTETFPLRPTFIGLAVLSAINLTTIVLVTLGVISSNFATITWISYMALFVWQYRHLRSNFEEALTIEGALRRLSAVTHYLETARTTRYPQLEALIAPLVAQQPSQRLRQATTVISGTSLRVNIILWLVVNLFIPWDYFFGWRLQLLKGDLRDQLPGWLDIWHEIEALASLANHADLSADAVFPVLQTDPTHTPVMQAQAIGHPLIPAAKRVTNDFTMRETGEIVIITGSNMAGKSSFLRTLGVSLCLTYAGGPVTAASFDTRLFRLYTSIRVTDSLDDGISYFYAEVRRLKGLLDALAVDDAPPLFFLIDEIFRGTNNRERLIGSRSYIRGLAAGHATGLIATHDLELVALEEENPRIRNAHFREEVVNGLMRFDYTLRDGPCPTTNALRIMALEGLPVEKVPAASGQS